VGHAGTLDPLATGVLLVCVGRAARLVEYLIGQPKTYETVIRLGQSTNTYDADGDVTAERPCAFTSEDLTQALAQFRGPIQQTPPLYSAIKKGGQPLYRLARQGVQVEVEARGVTIYELEQLAFEPPLLTLRVVCSAGTYIRSLAHDLGETLGCGGHVAALRRTAVSTFTGDTAVPLAHLTPENVNTWLQPLDTAVSHLPSIPFEEAETARLQQGQTVPWQASHSQTNLARAYAPDGVFIGIVILSAAKEWQPHKMFHPL
jgi:tRNA pseudouridine55 synthase